MAPTFLMRPHISLSRKASSYQKMVKATTGSATKIPRSSLYNVPVTHVGHFPRLMNQLTLGFSERDVSSSLKKLNEIRTAFKEAAAILIKASTSDTNLLAHVVQVEQKV
jgi:protein-arginine kinase